MFNTAFIVISLTLFIMIMTTIWMRVPKASIPLGLIFMIFMLSNRKTMEVHQDFIVNDEEEEIMFDEDDTDYSEEELEEDLNDY